MSCPGCTPVFQPNQLAHMDPGGCLWCSYIEENDQLQVEGELGDLFDEQPLVLDTGSETTVSSNNTECCICYETIDKSKNNCTTECGHNFCLKCLMTSFAHDNNACPCCRQELIALPDDDEEEEEEEDDEEEDIEDDEDDEIECSIEDLTKRLTSQGFNMQSILSMLLGRYLKDQSDQSVFELNEKFDFIVGEADSEMLEQAAMGMEDMNQLIAV